MSLRGPRIEQGVDPVAIKWLAPRGPAETQRPITIEESPPSVLPDTYVGGTVKLTVNALPAYRQDGESKEGERFNNRIDPRICCIL
ncbi:MAG: hypothetical protein OXD50_02980 [Chloroflexi bacterium]|nr:hypothetical protein [Chloroflexota bacterium]